MAFSGYHHWGKSALAFFSVFLPQDGQDCSCLGERASDTVSGFCDPSQARGVLGTLSDNASEAT